MCVYPYICIYIICALYIYVCAYIYFNILQMHMSLFICSYKSWVVLSSKGKCNLSCPNIDILDCAWWCWLFCVDIYSRMSQYYNLTSVHCFHYLLCYFSDYHIYESQNAFTPILDTCNHSLRIYIISMCNWHYCVVWCKCIYWFPALFIECFILI